MRSRRAIYTRTFAGVYMRKHKIDRDWMDQEPKSTAQYFATNPLDALKAEVKSIEDLPNLMTSKEAAEVLKVHYRTVELLMKSKKLTSMKIGLRRYTTPLFINIYLANEIKKNG